MAIIPEPRIVTTEAQPYAALHVPDLPFAEMHQAIPAGIEEVIAAIKAQGQAPTGAWFTHHLRRPTDTLDFEICFPVATAIEPHGRVQPGVWPAMKVARTIYTGPYTGLPQAWMDLDTWLKSQPVTRGAEFYERYLTNALTETDSAQYQTELNWPLHR